ncbi:MAG: AMP-binding protein, partial [Dehalococcoidia bacterium]|nr:AMP-binding protein [Dehalococcoidia bacterium]
RPALRVRRGFRRETWTHQQLAAVAARLAGALRAHDVEPGDRIVIVGPIQPEVVLAQFAAWWIGAAVARLPGDHASSVDDLARRVSPRLVIRPTGAGDRSAANDAPSIALDQLLAEDHSSATPATDPEAVAVIAIHHEATDGGLVGYSHRSVLRAALAAQRAIDPRDCTALAVGWPDGPEIDVWRLAVLARGGVESFLPRATARTLARTILFDRVSTMIASPSDLRALREQATNNGTGRALSRRAARTPPSLRSALVAGPPSAPAPRPPWGLRLVRFPVEAATALQQGRQRIDDVAARAEPPAPSLVARPLDSTSLEGRSELRDLATAFRETADVDAWARSPRFRPARRLLQWIVFRLQDRWMQIDVAHPERARTLPLPSILI